MSFVLCASCRRHVRRDDSSCPFCSAAVSGEPVPAANRRMPRGALFAFASTVAIAGCGSEVAPTPTPTDSGSQVDTGGAVPAYGAPADTGIVGEDTSGMVDDTGGAVPLYGGAPDM